MSRHTKKRRTFVRRFLPIRITPFRKGVADRRLQQRLEGIITECAEKVNFRAVPPLDKRAADGIISIAGRCRNDSQPSNRINLIC